MFRLNIQKKSAMKQDSLLVKQETAFHAGNNNITILPQKMGQKLTKKRLPTASFYKLSSATFFVFFWKILTSSEKELPNPLLITYV